MATRRIISNERTVLDRDEPIHDGTTSSSSTTAGASASAASRPTVPFDVLVKLLAFTFAMIVLPIGSYFATVNNVFNGNTTYAGGLAALMANVVLIGYVVVAMVEDQEDGDGQDNKSGGGGGKKKAGSSSSGATSKKDR